MIQFDEHIFQMGWFNHQLECISPWSRFGHVDLVQHHDPRWLIGKYYDMVPNLGPWSATTAFTKWLTWVKFSKAPWGVKRIRHYISTTNDGNKSSLSFFGRVFLKSTPMIFVWFYHSCFLPAQNFLMDVDWDAGSAEIQEAQLSVDQRWRLKVKVLVPSQEISFCWSFTWRIGKIGKWWTDMTCIFCISVQGGFRVLNIFSEVFVCIKMRNAGPRGRVIH